MPAMNPLRAAARPLLASVFVSSGIDVLRKPEPRAQLAGPVVEKAQQLVPALPQDPVTLVRANAAAQLAAGVMLATGRLPRLAALVLAGSMIPTTVAGHRFWELDEPAQRAQQRIHFLKNTAILGGLLAVAAG
jgi:putative oxidoreductase